MNSCVVTQVQVQVELGTHNYPTFVPELVIEGWVVGRHRNVLPQLALCQASFASVLKSTHPSQSIFKRTGWRNKSISRFGTHSFSSGNGYSLALG